MNYNVKYDYIDEFMSKTLNLDVGTLLIDIYSEDGKLLYWAPIKKENDNLSIDYKAINSAISSGAHKEQLIFTPEIEKLINNYLKLMSFI